MAQPQMELYPIRMPNYFRDWTYYTHNEGIYVQTLQKGYRYCQLPVEFRARFTNPRCVVYRGQYMPWPEAALDVTIILFSVGIAVLALVIIPTYHGWWPKILLRIGCLKRVPVPRRAWAGSNADDIPMTRPASDGLAGIRGELEPRPYDDQAYVDLNRQRARWVNQPQRTKLVWNPKLKWPAIKAGMREWALGMEQLRRRVTRQSGNDDGESRV
ncbi:hypothetical protein GGTG_09155 [Gaeumannomyces tritici R3-111a-1]|uniref:Uncharacterized protein n=1 Tax=Gaeumannomyces tritici (strain R3-111a-1) TaxID=644352 RepID=J3P6L3_GAET3|nr:hypothetical protein GGTG_09155 [Gaeumannomyces tritici R3-111a-1]EJT72289.1 hypothetical protein GGTG_09155 [Gaeumannomyces tritici R3-111a-1]